MQKHVNILDLVKSFPTSIYLQNLASMQPRTSLWKFGNLDGNSEIWTGENSYCNFQISVEIGNLNCGARVRIEDPVVEGRGEGREAADLPPAARGAERAARTFCEDRVQGSFSAVSKRNFASEYAFESSRRDLHNALLCTDLKSHFF